MMASGYSLHLYCDSKEDGHGWNEFPHEFDGETLGECKKEAQRKGWVFKNDRTHLCPRHSSKIKGKKKKE